MCYTNSRNCPLRDRSNDVIREKLSVKKRGRPPRKRDDEEDDEGRRRRSGSFDEYYEYQGVHVPQIRNLTNTADGPIDAIEFLAYSQCGICKKGVITFCKNCNKALCFEVTTEDKSESKEESRSCWEIFHGC